ncbi:MAG: hypothetical protein VR70_06845 [Rhodospirillaceae bacterium BRH_c57]|nr:MAG: hypothetical protein VR70_07920 [Rhodospirillaceae bacterium BRH_c57]KJS40079.1 MAG: hypothetical protein VR70_06845 [Rhodospirillaceae bacterium BRH_c57]
MTAPVRLLKSRALIADDEAHAANALRRQLAEAWPELEVVAVAEDGDAALEALRTTSVDIAFLDIRMPGRDGLQVAAAMQRPCLVVFVTAYEQFAVDAFERAAVDYLLKPVAPERLRQTIARLKDRLSAPVAPDFATTMQALSNWGKAAGGGPMKWVRAQQGTALRLIPVEDICYFQARDKYTSVWTPTHEFLIRTPLKDLEANLDPGVFWRVHRSYLVNAKYITAVRPNGLSTLSAEIRRPGGVSVPISRAQARRFRSM